MYEKSFVSPSLRFSYRWEKNWMELISQNWPKFLCWNAPKSFFTEKLCDFLTNEAEILQILQIIRDLMEQLMFNQPIQPINQLIFRIWLKSVERFLIEAIANPSWVNWALLGSILFHFNHILFICRRWRPIQSISNKFGPLIVFIIFLKNQILV